jgi:hypothetical protein
VRHADGAFFEGFRESEIADENLVVLIDQQVLRFQVAMDHAFGMRCGQRLSNLPGKIQNAFQRHFGIFADNVLQVLAFDEGHGNETQARDISHVVNAQNIFVGNLAGENQFLFEAFERVGFADSAIADHFNGYGAVEVFVIGLIYAAHAALAEERFDAVPRTEIAAGSDDGGVHHLNRFGLAQWHGSPAT